MASNRLQNGTSIDTSAMKQGTALHTIAALWFVRHLCRLQSLFASGHESALPHDGFEGEKSPKWLLWLPHHSQRLLDLARLPKALGVEGDFRPAYSFTPPLLLALLLFYSWAWVEIKSPKNPSVPPRLDFQPSCWEPAGSRWESFPPQTGRNSFARGKNRDKSFFVPRSKNGQGTRHPGGKGLG